VEAGKATRTGPCRRLQPHERIAGRSNDRTRDDEGTPRSARRSRRNTDGGEAQGGGGELMSRYFASRENSEAGGNSTRGGARSGRPRSASRAR